MGSSLNSNRRFDGRIRIVADQLEVLVPKIPKLLWGVTKVQDRQRTRRAAQLLTDLLEMIPIDVDISKSMDKISRHHPANNGDHLSQQRVGRNVERNTQKQVSTPLIQLTAQSSKAAKPWPRWLLTSSSTRFALVFVPIQKIIVIAAMPRRSPRVPLWPARVSELFWATQMPSPGKKSASSIATTSLCTEA